MLPSETDVLIVGAGPAGLALACSLQQAGIRHVLIDRLEEGQNTSRAAVVHAHTLEVLDSIGVAEGLVRAGMKLSTFTVRDRDRSLISASFDDLPSKYSYLLMIPQNVTEAILSQTLAALGGQVYRGCTATKVQSGEGGVRASVIAQAGERVIHARYVVGADGMHSVVREAAGIPFDGARHPESFVLADVRMQWPLRQKEVSLFFSEGGVLVVAPLPDGSYRVVATLEDPPEHPAIADVQAILDQRGLAAQPGKIDQVIWSSRFRVDHRLASVYRSGNLFLAGDAAHVHSPAGGQGMNCGLVDACVLGRLLSDVIGGKRAIAALDDYERLRRPAAAQVLALANRLTNLATARGPVRRSLRNLLLSLVNRSEPAKRNLALSLSGLARQELARLPPLQAS
jgi:2-polyprenyl-6-methoxyphenol hydroxylase-like FAD-dependent oxidoreductase